MKCYACNGPVVAHTSVKEEVTLHGQRCAKCGEVFYRSSEILKFEALTGRTKRYRKFGRLGASTIIRFPDDVLEKFHIKEGDLGLFEIRKEGILIRPVKI
jgi:hypothetical protein